MNDEERYKEHPQRYAHLDACICRRDGQPINNDEMDAIVDQVITILDGLDLSVSASVKRTSNDSEYLDLLDEVTRLREQVAKANS